MIVDPILYLPCSTPEFERRLWEAVLESPARDWDETEREYLRRNDGIRESIMDWAIYNYADGAWTEGNLSFLRPYLEVYQP